MSTKSALDVGPGRCRPYHLNIASSTHRLGLWLGLQASTKRL